MTSLYPENPEYTNMHGHSRGTQDWKKRRRKRDQHQKTTTNNQDQQQQQQKIVYRKTINMPSKGTMSNDLTNMDDMIFVVEKDEQGKHLISTVRNTKSVYFSRFVFFL